MPEAQPNKPKPKATIFEEFKKFAFRGNALDLAVAVIIGNAFSKIINSLVTDVITPVINLFVPDVDFATLSVTLRAPHISTKGLSLPAVTINYGMFLQSVFYFLVVAICIFAFFKLIAVIRARFAPDTTASEAEKPADVKLLEEIRDLLKEKRS